ncbi:MAG: hypothetical protein QXH27_05460 [Candidatus Micrarchaeia archaeon]
MICERCSEPTFNPEKCNYCSRMVCRSCEKSAKRVGRVKRLVICKDCWNNLSRRKAFKSS